MQLHWHAFLRPLLVCVGHDAGLPKAHGRQKYLGCPCPAERHSGTSECPPLGSPNCTLVKPSTISLEHPASLLDEALQLAVLMRPKKGSQHGKQGTANWNRKIVYHWVECRNSLALMAELHISVSSLMYRTNHHVWFRLGVSRLASFLAKTSQCILTA